MGLFSLMVRTYDFLDINQVFLFLVMPEYYQNVNCKENSDLLNTFASSANDLIYFESEYLK